MPDNQTTLFVDCAEKIEQPIDMPERPDAYALRAKIGGAWFFSRWFPGDNQQARKAAAAATAAIKSNDVIIDIEIKQ